MCEIKFVYIFSLSDNFESGAQIPPPTPFWSFLCGGDWWWLIGVRGFLIDGKYSQKTFLAQRHSVFFFPGWHIIFWRFSETIGRQVQFFCFFSGPKIRRKKKQTFSGKFMEVVRYHLFPKKKTTKMKKKLKLEFRLSFFFYYSRGEITKQVFSERQVGRAMCLSGKKKLSAFVSQKLTAVFCQFGKSKNAFSNFSICIGLRKMRARAQLQNLY